MSYIIMKFKEYHKNNNVSLLVGEDNHKVVFFFPTILDHLRSEIDGLMKDSRFNNSKISNSYVIYKLLRKNVAKDAKPTKIIFDVHSAVLLFRDVAGEVMCPMPHLTAIMVARRFDADLVSMSFEVDASLVDKASVHKESIS